MMVLTPDKITLQMHKHLSASYVGNSNHSVVNMFSAALNCQTKRSTLKNLGSVKRASCLSLSYCHRTAEKSVSQSLHYQLG